MKGKVMKKIASTLALAAVLSLTATLQAGQVVQNVSGATVVKVPANSDAVVSVPFVGKAIGSFTVSAKPGQDQLTLDTAPGTLSGPHYVRVTGGSAKGLWATISSVAGTTVVLQGGNNVFADLAVGDTVVIFPHNTLADALPATKLGSAFLRSDLNPATGNIIFATQVILWTDTPGLDQAPTEKFVYLDLPQYGLAAGWYTTSLAPAGGTVIAPDAAMVIRNPSDKALYFTAGGLVDLNDHGKKLTQYTTTVDDVYTSTARPVARKLKDLGLGGTAAFVNSTLDGSGNLVFGDQLIVFDNTAAGVNKAPTLKYIYLDLPAYGLAAGWYTTSFAPAGDVMVKPSTGMVIRKASANQQTTNTWTNTLP
jgi:uncharacterized protein (TIGR02597 family)